MKGFTPLWITPQMSTSHAAVPSAKGAIDWMSGMGAESGEDAGGMASA
jgi:hypothetical protein